MYRTIVALGAAVGLSLAACGGAAPEAPQQAAGSQIEFEVENLEPLEEGHYEGWAIVGERKLSFGSFGVNDAGERVDLSGNPVASFATEEPIDHVDAFAITIEPDDDADPGPSPTIILFGEASGGRATLAFDAIDVSEMSGFYVLATPTDDPEGNETAGVWFVDPTNAPDLAPSLNLPAAPAGWSYEGWAVAAGEIPISTGRFVDVRGADDSSPFSGTADPGPPFPGEDFLMDLPSGLRPPLALDDGKTLIVVTIEPDIDGVDPTGDGPSQLKPLVGEVPAGAEDHVLYELMLSEETLPSGTASLSR